MKKKFYFFLARISLYFLLLRFLDDLGEVARVSSVKACLEKKKRKENTN